MEEETTETPAPEKTDVEKVTDNYNELKEANDKVEAELLRGEQLRAKIAKGGRSDAGQIPEKPKEETPKEYRQRIDREMAQGRTEFGN